MRWKSDWAQAKRHFAQWWNHKGLAAQVYAPADHPHEDIPKAPEPSSLILRWLDPAFRAARDEHQISRTFFGGDAFPCASTSSGPGGLGTYLGAHPNFTPDTVWYEPCIFDPESYGPIRFNPENPWWRAQQEIIDEAVRRSRGRYLVEVPDVIENLDTLAAMRGSEPVLFDLIERPDWVLARQEEILQAFFTCFDLMYQKVKDADGGNAYYTFRTWGPGRTCKLQCDISCMLSPEMFGRFAAPFLARQADWLDYSVYHFDGTTAMQHLDALLAIKSLDAIQWTPQSGKPGPGNREWFDLYKRIKAGGKSVQAHGVKPDEIRPLLDAVGPEGMFITTFVQTQKQAQDVLKTIEQYR